MKLSIITYISLLFLKLTFIPNVSLLAWVFIAITVDFFTGIIKAKLLKIPITSTGFRKSVIKTLQYIGLIIGGIILANTIKEPNDITKWINDGMLLFIIYVEVYSILENFYAMDPNSKMSVVIIKPLMALLSLSFSKNPFSKFSGDGKLVIVMLLIMAGVSCNNKLPLQKETTIITKDSFVTKQVLRDTTIYLPADSVIIHDSIPCPDLVYNNKVTKGRLAATVAINKGLLSVNCNELEAYLKVKYWQQLAEYYKTHKQVEKIPYKVEVIKYKPPSWAWYSLSANALFAFLIGLFIYIRLR